MSLLLVGVGLVLTVTFFVRAPFLEGEEASAATVGQGDLASPAIAVKPRGGAKEPLPAREVGDRAGVAGARAEAHGEARPKARPRLAYEPEEKMLRVTIPAMARVEDDPVPYAAGDDEGAFKRNAGVHLEGTGDPWERGSNVFIAGHRLGYPNTRSWLAFWDLNKLRAGDRIFVTDSNGRRYEYKVFKRFVVDPTDVFVTAPVRGKSLLTLQTCTLPDYSRRLIIRAERVA